MSNLSISSTTGTSKLIFLPYKVICKLSQPQKLILHFSLIISRKVLAFDCENTEIFLNLVEIVII
jgi:hypothetical protein